MRRILVLAIIFAFAISFLLIVWVFFAVLDSNGSVAWLGLGIVIVALGLLAALLAKRHGWKRVIKALILASAALFTLGNLYIGMSRMEVGMSQLATILVMPPRVTIPTSVAESVAVAVDQLAQGVIAFNPPDEMNTGKRYEISVRITANLSDDALKEIMNGLKQEGGVPQTSAIRVGSEMRVELTALEEDDFRIQALSDAQQPMGRDGYAEWQWRVTPLRGGHKTLILKATAIIEIPGLLPKTKSLPVLEHEIDVMVNPGYSIRSLAADSWPWFVALGIALLVAWFWMRRRGGQSRGAGGQPTSPQAIDLVRQEQRKALTILFLAANPSDTARLRIDKESSAIDYALRQSKHRDMFEIEQHWAVRVTDLSGLLLRYQPDIVHFSGHGSTSSEIILEDEFGNGQPVSEHALSELFAILTDNIRCVVLNACFSKPQAEAIAKHIDCVIGMSEAIGDDAAISFAAAFYQALGFGRDIKTAFDLGCVQIDLKGLEEQEIPQLIAVRSDPRKIFLIKE